VGFLSPKVLDHFFDILDPTNCGHPSPVQHRFVRKALKFLFRSTRQLQPANCALELANQSRVSLRGSILLSDHCPVICGMVEQGNSSSRMFPPGGSKASGPEAEERSDDMLELEHSVRPPDMCDRDATEMHSWPLERAPTRPEADASSYTHVRHWINNFSMNARVPPEASRDHLANERTFLGWVRTSIALAIMGTVIAQLFRLQHSVSPRPL
jgi:hypothetical protein